MKKTYVKPEYKVFEIDRQVMLAGSNVNVDIGGDSNVIDYGGDTEGSIILID